MNGLFGSEFAVSAVAIAACGTHAFSNTVKGILSFENGRLDQEIL